VNPPFVAAGATGRQEPTTAPIMPTYLAMEIYLSSSLGRPGAPLMQRDVYVTGNILFNNATFFKILPAPAEALYGWASASFKTIINPNIGAASFLYSDCPDNT